MTAVVGWIGIWLLAAGMALIVIELLLITPRLLRLRRRILALEAVFARAGAERNSELLRLRAAQHELSLLLRPYRRARRWVLHPLTVALFESYRRRRSRS